MMEQQNSNLKRSEQIHSLEELKSDVERHFDANEKAQFCREKISRLASEPGQAEALQFLLESITNGATRDDCCLEAAKIAASKGHLDNVQLLSSSLSNDNKATVLRRECAIAAFSSHQEHVVGYMLELETEPDWLFQSKQALEFFSSMAFNDNNSLLSKTLSRMTPLKLIQLLQQLITGCAGSYIELASTLIKHDRFDRNLIDQPDEKGTTALMMAAEAGEHRLVENLLDLGATVDATDRSGGTALFRAVCKDMVRVAMVLIDKGANASHQDREGKTCTMLAQQFEHSDMLKLLNDRKHRCGEASDKQLSEELHRCLNEAGYVQERLKCQQEMADLLEGVARSIHKCQWFVAGSYGEGWTNNLEQVNGKISYDSDIDWVTMKKGPVIHLEGGCICNRTDKRRVVQGHAQVHVSSGCQPALSIGAMGVRPAMDIVLVILTCSNLCRNMIIRFNHSHQKLHLVKATRPNHDNELRVSFSLHEKSIIRELSTVQGQLLTIIKIVFKRLTKQAPGLKTYHAKTLLFFMLEKHGTDPNTKAWQPQNLITLLKESLDMMLSFIDSRSSPDECMPHFFVSDAPLYFKNAGIGGDFDNKKARVRERLRELRSDISGTVELVKKCTRRLQSEKFYFHLFTLLPFSEETNFTTQLPKEVPAKVMKIINICLTELQDNNFSKIQRSDIDSLLKGLLEIRWCHCTALCLKAMVHKRFREINEAENVSLKLKKHTVKRGLFPGELHKLLLTNSDWAWRFCFPCKTLPSFLFLPEFTQTLLTARLSQPRSSHLYVNFRCLSWSLQAELLRNRTEIDFDAWRSELQEDPDLEELLTLAHYSDKVEHVEFSLRQMDVISDKGHENLDNEIRLVREKFRRLSSTVAVIPEIELFQDDSSLKSLQDWQLSEAGFTCERAECQQRKADWLEGVAQVVAQDCRAIAGCYAECWGFNLVQVNGTRFC